MERRRIVVGAKQTLKAINKGIALRVYLAEDSDSFISAPVVDMCSKYSVPLEYIKSKSALGKMCHVEVATAVAAEVAAE